MANKKFLPLLLSFLSALLLWLAWPTMPFTPLIFIAFIPLLCITDRVQHRGKYFGLVFLSLWLWNVATTWWVGNTPVPASGIFANAFNALLMSIPWLGYKNTGRRLNRTAAYFSLIVYWLTFEYIHQTWELSWPWLVLGNGFAMHPGWIQWYEFTGASGGTLWVLLVNIAIYNSWKEPVMWKKISKPMSILLLPMLISALLPVPADEPAPATGVVVVQPNIDPYDEKFSAGTSLEQLDKFIRLTKEKSDSNTRYIVWPETALFPHGAWEHELNFIPEVDRIREMLRQFPKAKLISGAVTMRRYLPDEAPAMARTMADGTRWDAFNTALQIDTSQQIQIYHKYELVPGVELIPYARYLSFMNNLAMDFGGITGSYGRTPGVPLLTSQQDRISVLPTICYESVFSDYVCRQARLGANLLVIITNDGWWGNTEGHRQHLQYARLRAIETRRWIARSANTGISAIIDPAGNITQPQPYWKEAVISGTVVPRYHLTFYVKYGDLLSKGAVIFCILLLVYTFFSRFIYRRQHAQGHQ